MIFTASSFYRSLVVLAVVTLCISTPASAQNVFVNDITGTGARNFSDPTIWPTVPGPSNQAIIDFGDGTTDYVFVDAATSVGRINIGNANSGGLEIRSGATLTTTATGGSQSNIGPTGSGHLSILSGATLNQDGLLYLGLNAAGTGMVTLSDNGTHTLGGALAIRDGTGVYDMLGGTLTVGGFFQVARNGNGTFTQSGGTLQANHSLATQQGMFIAGGVGAVGLYEIRGGSLAVADTNLGVINGTTNVTGGAFGIFRIVGSAPTVTIGSNYDQRLDARFEVVIDSGGVSPMNIGGNVSLDGGLGVSFTTVPIIGQQFTIMNYSGDLTGLFSEFDKLVDSPSGPNSVLLRVDYGTGTDSSVVLTVVPEPSTLVLLGSGLGLMMLVRRRRVS